MEEGPRDTADRMVNIILDFVYAEWPDEAHNQIRAEIYRYISEAIIDVADDLDTR